jgi:hypothetical protein
MSSVATIVNLEAEVILKCENRATSTARVDIWIRDTLIEIAGNPDYRDSFPELEVIGPLFNLTGGVQGIAVQEYPETNFITISDFLIKTLDFLIWTDYPTNTNRKQLNPSNFQDSDKFISVPSLPVEWYRYGTTIGFNPPPNLNYQIRARYMRRHPIVDYFNASGLLNTTLILLPNEWYEVLEWAAAMRGFMELLNFERAAQIRTMLFGDPEHPNDNPGLIASIKTKRRAEAWLAQQALRPVVRGTTWGSS